MTIGTFTLLTLTGSLVVLKLALMALAMILLTKVLFPARQFTTLSGMARLLPVRRATR